MKLFSPAKINLFLYVTGKRPDGFHTLYSLMVPIDLGDEIALSYDGTGIQVQCGYPGVPEDHTNLAHRAACLFFDRYARKTGKPAAENVFIRIHKKIPPGGGLGGGSSNAATVLKALNETFGRLFSKQDLMDMGLGLGADVPFFIFGGAAFARGVGEKLEKAVGLPCCSLILCDPGVASSTAKVFEKLDFRLTSNSNYSINTSSNMLIGSGDVDLGDNLHNDLTQTACRLYPQIRSAREEMELLLKKKVHMSGSGSSLFALFPGEKAAKQGVEALERRFKDRPWKWFTASFLTDGC